jgi:hypothetical protein
MIGECAPLSIVLEIPAPNYKQHIFSPVKIRKVCYSLAELYVKPVFLIYLGGGGREVHETF